MTMSRWITPFGDFSPAVDKSAFVDVSARLIGRVSLAAGVSIWPGAVLRADDERIDIGAGSAVLDLCLLEAPHGFPVAVAPGALISHKACLHGARVETGALVGIGAIVLDGAVIGEGALVGAGALVPPGARVDAGMLVMGQPARPVRPVKASERANLQAQLADLEAKARRYRQPQA